MKVKELITLLQVMPQEQPVFFSHTDFEYGEWYSDARQPISVFELDGCTVIGDDRRVDIIKQMTNLAYESLQRVRAFYESGEYDALG